MCLCVFVFCALCFVFLHMHIRMHIHTCTYTDIHVHEHTSTCTVRTCIRTRARTHTHTHASEHCRAQGNALKHTHGQVGEYDVMAPLVAKEKQSVMQSLDAQVPSCCKLVFLALCHVVLALLLGAILQRGQCPPGLPI